MKILSFGEIIWDIYPDKRCLGGAPLNFAAHLAKHKEDAFMLSSVGGDDLGSEALKRIEQYSVSAKYVTVNSSKQTGQCLVTTDERGVPSYNILQDTAYAYISCKELSDSFDMLYFGSLALYSEHNYEFLTELLAKNSFPHIFADVNIRAPFYSKKTIKFCAENATILKISDEELEVTAHALDMEYASDYRSFASALAEKYANLKCIIITLGEDGAYALDCKAGCHSFCESERVKVKSTVGAGDSFSAAFLHSYLGGAPLAECLRCASKIAAVVVSHTESVPDYKV